MRGLSDEIVVQQNHCRHRLNDGHCTRQYTWVVTTFSVEGSGISLYSYGVLFLQDGGYRLESHAEIDVLSVAQSYLYSSTVIGGGGYIIVFTDKHIVLLASPH